MKVRKISPHVKKSKDKDRTLTFGPLLVLLRAPMPEGCLALSPRKVDLGLVMDKVLLGEQSLYPSDLTLVPLDGGTLLLGFQGKVADPFLQWSNLLTGFPSLGREIRALLPKLGRNLALLRELPLGRLPGSLLIVAGHPGVPLLMEEHRFLQGHGLERLQD